MSRSGCDTARVRRVWSIALTLFVMASPSAWAGAALAQQESVGAPAPLDAQALAAPGPYEVEVRDVVVSGRADGGADFDARLYIPLPLPPGNASQAAEAAVATGSPIVAFGHGYLAPVTSYEDTLSHLASWGITAIAPRSAGGLLPDHAEFAADLSAAAAWVAKVARPEQDWPGLPVDSEARGLSGHSMGGGAAVMATSRDPSVRTVATLSAADTRPSAIEAAAGIAVPALYVAGSEDAITPVEGHQQPMFEATVDAPAQLRVIEGGSHCGFLDRPILPGIVCDRSSVEIEAQLALTRAALVAWLRTELVGDEATAGVAWPGPSAEGLRLEVNELAP